MESLSKYQRYRLKKKDDVKEAFYQKNYVEITENGKGKQTVKTDSWLSVMFEGWLYLGRDSARNSKKGGGIYNC